MRILYLFLTFLFSANVFAHTWDEPWHKEVVAGANSFSVFKVIKNSGETLQLELVRHIAGEKPERKIKVDGFYLYTVASTNSESDEHDFWLDDGVTVYMHLLKQGEKYKIATPTSGYAEISDDGSVVATYRHSLHQAKVHPETYEQTQICIFKQLHGENCSKAIVNKYIVEPLNERVATLSAKASAADFELFFRQHVALETAFLIGLPIKIDVLEPFLNSRFFHTEISAVRALVVSPESNIQTRLVSFIQNNETSDIAKVVGVMMLKELEDENINQSITNYLTEASDEDVFFGGSLMDPRIGTWFPRSVKAAIEWYMEDSSDE